MPVLQNPRHERFAQELAKGKTADDAYVSAGYQENRHNASRLKTNETIAARVAEIQERAAVRVEITVASLTEMLLDDRELARKSGQTAAAVSAVEKIAKLHGLMVEKREVRTGLLDDLDADSRDATREAIREELARRFGGSGQAGPSGPH